MSDEFSRSDRDREILSDAQDRGRAATAAAFVRLSGPGWLQAAITLGGGSLASALYLGMLGGTSLLWMQLLAIIVGVIMLSAISYVTLSTGERPYRAMNEHINPVLGVGWLTATIMANMIFIMPQFSLCYDVFDSNLGMKLSGDATQNKWIVSSILFAIAAVMVFFSTRGGILAKLFDWFLKLMVAIVVLCFFGLVIFLIRQGEVTLEVLKGFIPDFTQWGKPTPEIAELIGALPEDSQKYWNAKVVGQQQLSMISAAATAVGINMTFLLPYSMLNRGWDRSFRGFARFDLMTGMAIPYLLVTSCIVIAAAHSFHAKADEQILGDNVEVIQTSGFYKGVASNIDARATAEAEKAAKAESDTESESPDTEQEVAIEENLAEIGAMPGALTGGDEATQEQQDARSAAVADYFASLSAEERKLHVTMLKPNTAQLAQSLEPLLGKQYANWIFGVGVLGMGFSTIVVLMMINGFAFREMFNRPESQTIGLFGAMLAGGIGVCWVIMWTGPSKTWFTIMASSFAAILLPIAYFAFMLMMNCRSLMQEDKPSGIRMWIWNILMTIGVVGAGFNAYVAIQSKLDAPQSPYMIGAIIAFGVLVLMGFSAKSRSDNWE